MNKHILFLLGTEYSANGLCTYKVIDEIEVRGHKASVICYGDQYSLDPYSERPNIHTIPLSNAFKDTAEYCLQGQTKKGFLREIIGKLRTLLLSPIYPIRQPLSVGHYINMAEQLMKIDRIDTVVAVMRPVETALAACALKKRHPELTTAIYELDSVTNNVDSLVGWTKYVHFLVKRTEMRVYCGVDYIIHMRCNENYYNQAKYAGLRNNFVMADIPLLTPAEVQCRGAGGAESKNGVTTMLYAGYLIKAYRSPDYVIELVKAVSGIIKIRCDFYSRGNCEKDIARSEEETQGVIHACGYVSQDKLDEAIAKTDFLVNISLHYASTISSIPSKIFVYMAAGKSIIHIYNSDNDVCLPYLAKYPLVLLLDQRDDLEENVRKLADFITAMKGKLVVYDEIADNFLENTPSYTAEVLIDIEASKNNIGRKYNV